MMTPKKSSILIKALLLSILFIGLQSKLLASTIYGISFKNSDNYLHSIDTSNAQATLIKTFKFGSEANNYWLGEGAIIASTKKLYTANSKGVLYEFNLTDGNISTYNLNKNIHRVVSDSNSVYIIASDSLASANKLYKFTNGSLSSELATVITNIANATVIKNTEKLYINSTDNRLYEYDLATGTATAKNMNITMQNIISDSDNMLYGIKADKLYKIDPSTGSETLLSTLNISGGFWVRSASINTQDNRLYIISKTNNRLYSFNLTDGSLVSNSNLSNSIDSTHIMQSLNTLTPVVITPTNNAPTNILLSSLKIKENNSIGDVIGGLSVEDLDSGDSHTYSLACTGVDNSSFSIDGNLLKAGATFDYETKNSYSICIRVNDGTANFDKVFTISITNSNEAPTSSNPTYTIDEDTSKTFALNDFSFNDNDGDSLHSILITSIPNNGDFQLNGVDVTNNQIKIYS